VIVVDTNAVVHLLLGGEHTERARRVLRKDPEWAAPLLWRSEFRNVLAVFMRQRRLAFSDALAAAREAEDLLSGREYAVDSASVLELTSTSKCSAYDCEFVALARDLRVPLLTSDAAVRNAFPRIAVALRSFA
jgi:predicted nucleic acid-binding protein